ncbi:hypothetical protein ON010_g11549 [Phytophthora cinnamomi]|nr:hypothetical protein ON010_g11549 [Phytophthora cinnamomi]
MLSFRFRDLVHLLLGLCLLLSVLPSVIADEQVAEATVDPDVGTTVVEIIEARGYEVETHKVTTSDGYILTMYRIPKTYAESQSGSAANKTAVTVFSTVRNLPTTTPLLLPELQLLKTSTPPLSSAWCEGGLLHTSEHRTQQQWDNVQMMSSFERKKIMPPSAHYVGSFFLPHRIVHSHHHWSSPLRYDSDSFQNRPPQGKMVLVSLQCAIVGQVGSSFDVEIDDGAKVNKLKKGIAEDQKYDFAASKLQLFLAKTEGGAWVTEADVKNGMKGADESKALDNAGAPLNLVRLSGKDVQFTPTIEDVKAKMTPVHVLVVVPEQEQQSRVESAHDSFSMLCSMRRDMMELKEVAFSLSDKDKSFYDGALGQLVERRLRNDEVFVEAAPTNGEAFWSEKTQSQANAFKNETAFDTFITPYFNDVLGSCGMVFVNSERYQWLSQSPLIAKTTDLKPVGFATHRGMFRAKPVPNDRLPRPSGFRFGVAEEELYDCLILFESKITIGDSAFGQVVRYLQNICPKASASAILFDARSFWLIKSHQSVVVKVQVAKWANKGSKSLFRNFISDNVSPWVARLTLACSCLGVDVVEGDAFLGRGAHGRVFKVIGQDGKVFALKIVEKCSVRRLYQEEKALMIAQHTGLTISAVGKLIETPEGAALLLSPVGKPLPRPTTRHEDVGEHSSDKYLVSNIVTWRTLQYQANKDRIKAAQKRYYQRTREARLPYQKGYDDKNREQIRARKRKSKSEFNEGGDVLTEETELS